MAEVRTYPVIGAGSLSLYCAQPVDRKASHFVEGVASARAEATS